MLDCQQVDSLHLIFLKVWDIYLEISEFGVVEADYTKPYLKNVRVHIGAGTFDDAYRAFAQPLEQELLENGIPYTMDIIPGGHQWSVWRKLLEKFLSR